MEIVINDTNIFLDLYDIGLLDTFFRLPMRVHTVDFVVNEITRPSQAQAIQQLIDKGMLVVKDYPATDITNLYQFNVECGGNLTLTDSTVIYYAKSLTDCRILTGDRSPVAESCRTTRHQGLRHPVCFRPTGRTGTAFPC